MENNIENFLKNKLSADEMDLGTPDLQLVESAREKVMSRKKNIERKQGFLESLWSSFGTLFNPLPAGITAFLIIGGIFYFTSNETQKTELALNPQNSTGSYSINSSTVLASLTQYTNNKTATASSTVLSSIVTFVAKN